MRSLMVLLAAVVAGCATYPDNASYIHGERYYRANIRTYPTVVTAVDGRSIMRTSPVIVEPGPHAIELTTVPAAGFRFSETRELRLDVEPCKRYFIVAERDNRLQQDWRPLIEHVESAGGTACR